MKLYHFPHACSLGINVLLEETGAPYELALVNLRENEQKKPPFIEINPKGKVPALARDDGGIITEYPAIAYYIARKFPEAKLLPEDLDAQTKVLELLDYMISNVHMRGFTRMFRASTFSPSEADEPQVVAAGRDVIEKGFHLLSEELGEKDYLAGDFSIADSALFFLERWAGTRANMPLSENLARHLARMLGRPAVQRALDSVGLA